MEFCNDVKKFRSDSGQFLHIGGKNKKIKKNNGIDRLTFSSPHPLTTATGISSNPEFVSLYTIGSSRIFNSTSIC